MRLRKNYSNAVWAKKDNIREAGRTNTCGQFIYKILEERKSRKLRRVLSKICWNINKDMFSWHKSLNYLVKTVLLNKLKVFV